MSQRACAHRRCRRKPTQAFDVGSWWRPRRESEMAHYEVCDKHASYFAGSFDRQASERVEREMVPWRPAIPPAGGMPIDTSVRGRSEDSS